MATVLEPERWEEYGIEDPEMAKVLKEKPVPSLGSWGNAAGCRKGMADMVFGSFAIFPQPDLSNVHQEEFQIPSRDGRKIRAIHMRPKDATSGCPLLVCYHGGGFVAGSAEFHAPIQIPAAQNMNVSSVNIEYRKAPEHRFPTAVHDAEDGLKWCLENAKQLHADPSSGFVLTGASSGGNIAAVVALLARDEGISPPITGLHLDSPLLVAPEAVPDKYKPWYKAYTQNANQTLLDKVAMDYFISEYQPDLKSHLFSPLIWPGGHQNHPPVYFSVKGTDILRDDALIYEKMLREEYGIKTKIDVYPGLFHTFVGFRPETSHTAKAIQDSVAGLVWLFSGAP